MWRTTGLHEADALKERRTWKVPAVMVCAGANVILLVAGGILSAAANADHKNSVFDWADFVNHVSMIFVVIIVVIVYRMHRAVMRAMRAAVSEDEPPGPGEQAGRRAA